MRDTAPPWRLPGLGWRESWNHPAPGTPRFASPAPCPPGAPEPSLHVATCNLQLGARLEAALARIAAEPALARADMLALQEVDEGAAARLAERLGAGYVYYPSARHPQTGRNFGPALLSRWPIVDDAKLPLPGPRGLLRIAVRATVAVGERPLTCYNAHLSTLWETLPAGQDRQVDAILADAAGREGTVVVTGDFNRRGAAARVARAGFRWLTRDVGATHWVWSFDHVLVRGHPDGPAEAGSVAALLAASDHKAVWARLGGPGR